MSIWLIFLLAIIFLVFVMSCVIIVAWIATGANDVSASNTLDLVPIGQDTIHAPEPISLTADKVTELANKGMRVLVADQTGGFTITTGGVQNEGNEGNKLVQTLYIGGKPAVTRTTTFADATVERTEGPMQLNQPNATKEIVEWFDHIKNDANVAPHGPPFKVQNMDLNDLMEATHQKKNVRDDTAQEEGDRKLGYENLRREYLLPALEAEAKRRDEAAARLRDPHRFHIVIKGRQLCALSSTLQIPVQLFVPPEYSTSPAALNGRFAQWSISQISKSVAVNDADVDADADDVSQHSLDQKLLWQSDLIPLAELSATREHYEVSTTLNCATVAHFLMRLKLVEVSSTTQPILCSAFFNPASMISNGVVTFGTDMRTAWHMFRQIQNQPR